MKPIDRENIVYRGSRKHVLDRTSRPGFRRGLVELLAPVDVRIPSSSKWMPRGYGAPAEARLESFGPDAFGDGSSIWTELRRWWLVHERGANTPNWDLALSCEIEGRPGLVLVEAKANVPELSALGKPLDATASKAGRDNHERIGAAIAEACAGLRLFNRAVRISRDSHYQLSNRLAFAWKLATLGLPTVLVYLGFCGDGGIADVGEPFQDAEHWNKVFASHVGSLVPRALFERRLECRAAPAWLLVRSRRVLESSTRPRPRLSRRLRLWR